MNKETTCECGHEWHIGECKHCDCTEARKDPDSGFDELEYEILGEEYLHD